MNLFLVFHLLKLIRLYFPLRTKSLIFRFHLTNDTSTGRSLQSAVNPDMEFLDICGPRYGDSIIFFTDGSKAKEPGWSLNEHTDQIRASPLEKG